MRREGPSKKGRAAAAESMPQRAALQAGGSGALVRAIVSMSAARLTPSAAQQTQIKQAIYAHLKENDVFAALKAIVTSVLGGESVDSATSDAVLAAAQHKSMLARLVSAEAHGAASSPHDADVAAAAATASADTMLLHVLLLGGRAFSHVESAAEADDNPAPLASSAGDTVCVCLHFGDQRFRSKPVPFAAEPALRDGVLFELPSPDASTRHAMAAAAHDSDASLERLRGVYRSCEPMHVLVLKTRGSDGTDVLLSSCMLEWRDVLHEGRKSLSIELPGVGAEATLPTGCLELKMELLPRPPRESRMTEAEVFVGLKKFREAQVEVERTFFAYARSWWNAYLAASPQHAQRPVKLFALSELGTQRPVTAFLQPLRAGRLLETPSQAAHFVSLLVHTRETPASASVADVWKSVHATLATRAGETEEHALLLCSLLLGFGLDAYVCVGSDGRGPHAWVLSRDANLRITFWETLTGQQYPLDGASGHPFLSLACVFSHAAFYANLQPSTRLGETSLDLADPRLWKAMDPKQLATITPLPMAPLQPSTLRDAPAAAAAAEASLRALVDEHRASLGLSSPGVEWDEQLSHLLSPALFSYESERVSGHPVGQALFADAIKRAVPTGHTFKGLPLHFVRADPRQIFAAWMDNEVACDVVRTRTHKASLALRVRVSFMPDDVVSVWVMLAIAYRPD